MQKLDNEFFETFKALEKLCSDRFDCPHGVSEYITRMEASDAEGFGRIPTWNEDFRMLKHIRWVRNQIAHESSDTACCEKADIAAAAEFTRRMSAGEDPLSLLSRPVTAAKKAAKSAAAEPPKKQPKTAAPEPEKKPAAGRSSTVSKASAADKKKAPAKSDAGKSKSAAKKKTSRKKRGKKSGSRAAVWVLLLLLLCLLAAGGYLYFRYFRP